MTGDNPSTTDAGPSGAGATEVLFYQLDRRPLERVLPALLERSLERGWRVVVQAASMERVEALDALLWTYDAASFLPHGGPREGAPALQPIYLTTESDNPSGAHVRFLVDGADLATLEGYARIVCLFDGRDPEAVARAREQWRRAREAGCSVTFWRQNERGLWQKQA